MRFDRTPKVEGLRWTSRMQALHLSRQDRARQKIERAYPLFSDQIETPQALSVDEERVRRERLLCQSEQRMRDLYAQQWRRLPREYFACTSDVRARIMGGLEGVARSGQSCLFRLRDRAVQRRGRGEVPAAPRAGSGHDRPD
ncbi:hypothetical protein [Paraburkholderia youngii]|uniref:hypothetical protein n=1 Tax=Paraburkholderia youngii TaxID=2782701 RepID=UPI003D22EAC2